jgi:hypothetical protein
MLPKLIKGNTLRQINNLEEDGFEKVSKDVWCFILYCLLLERMFHVLYPNLTRILLVRK